MAESTMTTKGGTTVPVEEINIWRRRPWAR